jgi:hypothetical protein
MPSSLGSFCSNDLRSLEGIMRNTRQEDKPGIKLDLKQEAKRITDTKGRSMKVKEESHSWEEVLHLFLQTF